MHENFLFFKPLKIVNFVPSIIFKGVWSFLLFSYPIHFTIITYHTLSNISWLDYKPNIRFPSENLPKIENSYISRVEKKKRNLAKYVKNKILPCRKTKKFSVQTYRQKSENFPNLQVMRKKKHLSHLCSNKTARTGCNLLNCFD